MTYIDELEAFHNFLIRNNCLEKYINLEYACTTVSRTHPRYLYSAITNIAEWSSTKEGSSYWHKLHDIWECRDLRCLISINDILAYLKTPSANSPYEFW
jgi:hypothetical protein